jgi:hypothetical protein
LTKVPIPLIRWAPLLVTYLIGDVPVKDTNTCVKTILIFMFLYHPAQPRSYKKNCKVLKPEGPSAMT